jgi:hypothetical protein
MTPATIIQQAASDGVSLVLSVTGTIKVLGDETAVGRWLPTIRENKVAIITALKVGAGDMTLTAPQIEALTGAIPLAREVPQPEAENPPGADPACLVSLNGTEGETEILALKVGAGDMAEPFDREAFEERAAICEFDGGLTRADAESLAWREDDRRRCTQCQNRRAPDGVCRIAEPKAGALVVANRSYAPDPVLPRRCEGYAPGPDDPDRRHGRERWPGLTDTKGGE